ncbi:MAG: DUF4349 domain-containing protein [Clostridia bacterium]|nr:DUF4349 domain-containing protein [Clostridia bacterium]
MKKLFKSATTILIAVMLICTLLAGCAAKSEDMAYTESATSNGVLEDGDYALDGEIVPEDDAAAQEGEEGEEEYEAKIIRNADISMEADDARECYSQLLDYAKSLGGYESSVSLDSYESETRTSIYLYAEIKLPPESLDDFVSKAGELGEITYYTTNSQEITEEYYDVKTRLETQEKALESYYALLEKAETMEEIISVQNRIDDLTEEIEALKGKLRLYDSKVDMSTVTLNISEYTTVQPSEKEFEWDSLDFASFCKLIKNGFLGVVNFLWSLLQWLLIIVIAGSPLILIAVVVLLVVRAYRKKHPVKKAEIIPARNAPAAPAKTVSDTGAPTYEVKKD